MDANTTAKELLEKVYSGKFESELHSQLCKIARSYVSSLDKIIKDRDAILEKVRLAKELIRADAGFRGEKIPGAFTEIIQRYRSQIKTMNFILHILDAAGKILKDTL